MVAPLDYRFDHLHVFCSDVEATERWLVGGLGLVQAKTVPIDVAAGGEERSL